MYSNFLCDVKLCKKSLTEKRKILNHNKHGKMFLFFKNNSHNNGHLNYVIIDRSLFNLNKFFWMKGFLDVIEISISILFCMKISIPNLPPYKSEKWNHKFYKKKQILLRVFRFKYSLQWNVVYWNETCYL